MNAALSLLMFLEEVGVKIQPSLQALPVVYICTVYLCSTETKSFRASLKASGTCLEKGIFVSCVPSITFHNSRSTTSPIPNPMG